MRIFISALAASLALAIPAAAAEQVESAEKKAEAEKPKKICRTIRNTGFRTAARQCKTEEQWKMDQERADGSDLQTKNDSYQPN
jgi:ribosome recycling factor